MPLPARGSRGDADVGRIELIRTRIGLTALASVLVLLTAACEGFSDAEVVQPQVAEPVEGGRLNVGISASAIRNLDPAARHTPSELGLLRLMVRTLLTYPGRPTPQGNYLVPDIAASLPQVSQDLLTWTYTLQTKARFGPPVSRFVICDDFEAAFERLFTTRTGAQGVADLFSMIEGADSFVPGEDLEGVHCQDQHTLVFHLTAPVGDFASRTALPAASPIPAAENAVRYHERDYGRFLVATGPFMWKGIERVDFSDPLAEPPEGSSRTQRMTLTRNPEWAESSDDVRKAYLDAIRIVSVGKTDDPLDDVTSGALDVVDRPSLSREALMRLHREADLRDRFRVEPDDTVSFLWMNLRAPPFDDAHVRKAVNYVVDKKALQRMAGGAAAGDIATHVLPPSMPGSLSARFDPYPTLHHRGDVRRAKEEMRRSRYDGDGDGKCDVEACEGVPLMVPAQGAYPDQAASLRADLRGIGVVVRLVMSSPHAIARPYRKASKKAPLGLGKWSKEYGDASSFISRLFRSSRAAHGGRPSHRSRLQHPSLAHKVRSCLPRMGRERDRCWAETDEYIMEEVVAWVPLLWGKTLRLYSGDVASMPLPYDQFSGMTAYDQVFLKKEAIE